MQPQSIHQALSQPTHQSVFTADGTRIDQRYVDAVKDGVWRRLTPAQRKAALKLHTAILDGRVHLINGELPPDLPALPTRPQAAAKGPALTMPPPTLIAFCIANLNWIDAENRRRYPHLH